MLLYSAFYRSFSPGMVFTNPSGEDLLSQQKTTEVCWAYLFCEKLLGIISGDEKIGGHMSLFSILIPYYI